MAITLHTTKGTHTFETVRKAAEWLEDYQPSAVDVSFGDDAERHEIDCDGAWTARDAEQAINTLADDVLPEYAMDVPVYGVQEVPRFGDVPARVVDEKNARRRAEAEAKGVRTLRGLITAIERRVTHAPDAATALAHLRAGDYDTETAPAPVDYEAEYGLDALDVLFVDGEPYGDDDQIEALLREAGEAGDTELAEICRAALGGDYAARCACSVALTDAIAAAGAE